MTFLDILQRSWHNIGRAKVRVGLTAAALAIGAATMTLALAVTQGVEQTIQAGFGNMKNTFVSVEGFATKNTSANGVQTSEEAESAEDAIAGQRLKKEDIEKFKNTPGVTQVTPLSYYGFDNVEINGQSYKSPTVDALTPVADVDELVAGKREDLKGDTVIVPERYMKQAGVSNPKDFIGKQLVFVKKGVAFFRTQAPPDVRVTLTVVAVTKSDADNANVSSEYVYLSPEKMSSLAEAARGATKEKDIYYNRIILTTEESKTESVKDGLKAQGYEAITRKDSIGKALESVAAIRTFLLVFAAIAIFTAIFGVINTQLMSVMERTREIGLMKALGLSRSGILLMFSIEAAWIGLIGSIIGTLIAIPISLLIGATGSGASAPITLPNFLTVVVSLVFIAMVSGLLPARRAAKLDPVEALRNE